ncbi:unnamed protein product [Thelazia callipaeda]|uniref:SSD domain-containing protein n=1 Tax=Thelazia callipaeda TaxID=103827 RepID=A0A158RAM8_THECL|nr:unnamed protein product [Thelazia callipaeda]
MYASANRYLAESIASHPTHFIVLTLVISALLSLSLFNCTWEDDIRRGFSSPKSRAAKEEAVFLQFYNITNVPWHLVLLFEAKDGGTMLRENHMQEMYKIDKDIYDAFNAVHFARPICYPFCHVNMPVKFFWEEFSRDKNRTESYDDNNSIFAFPTSTILDQEVFLGANLFGVQYSDKIFTNRSNIIRVNTITLWYSAYIDDPFKNQIFKNITVGLFAMSKINNATKWINFKVFGDEIANREMIQGAIQATKLMLFGFLLLLTFVFIVVYIKIELSSIPQIIFAILSPPIIASVVSFAIVCWMNFPFYSIMCVTPFLVIGIGVDDSFIMMQVWCRFGKIVCRKERLIRVFNEIGPSVSITSITNMVAFGIGYFTPTPQMSLFCLCTSLACFFDYIFTFTLFAPIICMAKSKNNNGYTAPLIKLSRREKRIKHFIASYCKMICSRTGRISVIFLLMVLYTLSTLGVAKMKRIFDDFFPLQIFINQPPDISNSSQYNDFYDMVKNLEAVPYSLGVNKTMVFLKAYEIFDHKIHNFLHTLGLIDAEHFKPSYDNLPIFVDHIQNPTFIKMTTDEKLVLV